MQKAMTICIDSYDRSIPVGRLFCAGGEEAQHFDCLMSLLFLMEQILDETKSPQAFESLRSFGEPSASEEPPFSLPERRGNSLATFTVRVLFRRNASWQGSITWIEGGQEISFRSVLEFIFLIHSSFRRKSAQPT